MALTKSQIKAAAAADGRKTWLKDGKVPGLGVLVLPSGVKTWYLRYYLPDGKEQQHRIGRADSIAPEVAREEAHKVLAAAAQGGQPTSARQELRRSPTITVLAQRVEDKHYWKLKPGTRANYELIWRLHLLPKFGAVKVAQLRTGDVYDWFTELSKATPIKANRCLEVLSKAMALAEVWGLRPQGSNPCDGVAANTERKRRRYLSRDELGRLLAALDTFAAAGVRWRFAQLVRLLLLTGCRINELMAAPWSWYDDSTARLTLPPGAHKTGGNGHERIIHLPPAAVQILQELRHRSNSPWIIAGNGDGHLVGYWRMWCDLIKAAGINNLRPHDARHSWASWAITKAGLTLPQVGGLLGHASPQTTARYAHLLDEAAAAMAAQVAAAISPA